MLKHIILPVLATSLAAADFRPANSNTVNAIIAVESGGNNLAYNKSENAIGCLQIRKACFLDAQQWNNQNNNILGLATNKHSDCTNRLVSIKVFNAYINRYNAKTPEEMARLWNSGPNWQKKKSLTNNYWNKVKNNLTIKTN